MDALIISYKELLQRDDNNIKGVPRHSTQCKGITYYVTFGTVMGKSFDALKKFSPTTPILQGLESKH
jgi:hypothetical protein